MSQETEATLEKERSFSPTMVKTGLLHLAAAIQQKSPPFLLLVEDDDHDTLFFQNALKKAGVSVQFLRLKSGNQALEYFQGKGRFADRIQFPLPRLTLLDFRMPGGSGLDVFEYIRASPQLARSVVVAFTASRDAGDIQAAARLGINAYIIKPVDAEALLDIVQGLKVFLL